MKNLNDAKFVKGIIDDQLEKECVSNFYFSFSKINKNDINEYYVEFNVAKMNGNIELLIDDIQYITKFSCIITREESNTNIRFY